MNEDEESVLPAYYGGIGWGPPPPLVDPLVHSFHTTFFHPPPDRPNGGTVYRTEETP